MKITVTIESSKEEYMEAVRQGWYDEYTRTTASAEEIARTDDVENLLVAFEHLANNTNVDVRIEE